MTEGKKLSLVKRILIGLAVGVLLALLVPGWTFLALLGKLFVGTLKALAPILVFLLVTSAISHQKSGQKSHLSGVILLYLLGTFLSGLAAKAAMIDFIAKT